MMQREMMKGPAYNPNAQVSGRSIPYSPWQGMTKIGKALINKNAMNKSDERTGALNQQQEQGQSNAFDRVMAQLYGQEGQPAEAENRPSVPAIQADPVKAALMAQSDQNPNIQSMGKMIMPRKYNPNATGSRSRPVVTNEGIYEQTADGWSPMIGKSGNPLMGGYVDPTLQGSKARNIAQNKAEVKGATEPQIQSDIASAKLTGAAEGQAKVDLPMAEVKASETLTLIDELLDHPGFKDAVGFWDNPLALGGLMPATEAAGFRSRLKQLEGRTFMEIFPTLKGGGQITEIEGEKGQLSINRMAQATNEEEFIKAATDFKAEVKRLREVVRTKAGKPQAATTPSDVEPAVWELMSDEEKALWTN